MPPARRQFPQPPISSEDLARERRLLGAPDGRDEIAEAARSARIANLARTPLRGDMLAYAFDSARSTGHLDLVANRRFSFPEAVAGETRAERVLLPHGDAHVTLAIAVAERVEIHHVARRVWTETMLDLA